MAHTTRGLTSEVQQALARIMGYLTVAAREDPCGIARLAGLGRAGYGRVDQEPQEHLSSEAAALVAAGCSVEADHRNAVRSWTGVDRRRLAKLAEEKGVADAQLRRMDEALASGALSLARARLVRIRMDYATLAGAVTRNAAALNEYDMLAEMARSAAERLLIKSDRSRQAARLAAPTTRAAQEELRLVHASRLIDHLQQQAPAGYPPDRFILVDRDPDGTPVPIGFGAHDLALLRQPGVAPRLHAQLEKTATFLALEVDRLLAAVRAQGLSSVIQGRLGGKYLPGTPDDLHRRYRNHPRYRAGEGAALAAYDRARREAARVLMPSIAAVATSPAVTAARAIASVDPAAPVPADVAAGAGTSRTPEHGHTHQPTSSVGRGDQQQHQPPTQRGVEPSDTIAATAGSSALPPMPVALNRTGADAPVPSGPATDVATVRPGDGANDQRADAVDVPAATPPSAKDALSTLAQLAARKRATPLNDRLRALRRDGKGVEDAAENLPIDKPDPVHEATECLRDMRFVPLRERDGRLTIVVDCAIKEDEDALRRIRQVEQEAVIQALLRRARDAMLARLRNPDELLGDKDDRRCDAAVRAAHNDPEVVRLMLARPSGAAGAGIAALRAKMRERSEQGPKDERTPEHEVDDDALYRAMLEKHRSDQLKR